MGRILNPGNNSFRISLNGEIFVDKSMLIKELNKKIYCPNRFLAVSRPRRFGKSMALQMLCAYYSKGCESRELFKGLKIENEPSFEKHLNKYNVIYITMTDYSDIPPKDFPEAIKEELIENLEDYYPEFEFNRSATFERIIDRIYQKSGIPFVFLIDEWDLFMRKSGIKEEEKTKYLDFLRRLLKDREYVALCYMTGILPVKKYGEHSALNMFYEYSMECQNELTEFTGFTEEEITALCLEYEIPVDHLKRWYNGYSMKKPVSIIPGTDRSYYDTIDIYSPCSVVKAIQNKRLTSYWTKTETYEALKIPINLGFDGLQETIETLMSGEEVHFNINKFKNDFSGLASADEVLGMLVHLGYLSYDCETKKARIPNLEIFDEYVTSISGDSNWAPVMNAINQSEKLMKATLTGDEETVARIIHQTHIENTSIIKFNDENSLSCIVTLAYFTAIKDYLVKREFPTGKGFADIVFLPRPGCKVIPIVVELKSKQSASIAIEQIKNKEYCDSLKNYSGEIILVGINYEGDYLNPEYKEHSCKIERIII